MTVLIAGLGLLASAFVAHLALWRLRTPQHQTRALLLVFSIVPMLALMTVLVTGISLPFPPPEIVSLALLYISCALGYVVLHSAIETESPTLAIVSYVAMSGDFGRSELELAERFARGTELISRLSSMESSGWVRREDDDYFLTPRGRCFARLFEYAAHLFGLPAGG